MRDAIENFETGLRYCNFSLRHTISFGHEEYICEVIKECQMVSNK